MYKSMYGLKGVYLPNSLNHLVSSEGVRPWLTTVLHTCVGRLDFPLKLMTQILEEGSEAVASEE